VYWLNEKGAVSLADGFARTPSHLAERVAALFGHLGVEDSALEDAASALTGLVAEVRALLP
jgi:hypothetical protein